MTAAASSTVCARRVNCSVGWRGFLLYGAVPAFGIAADGYVLVRSFGVGHWNEGESGRSVLRCDVGCAVIARSAYWTDETNREVDSETDRTATAMRLVRSSDSAQRAFAR